MHEMEEEKQEKKSGAEGEGISKDAGRAGTAALITAWTRRLSVRLGLCIIGLAIRETVLTARSD